MFQRTDIEFYPDEEHGRLRVPEWDNDDERWHTEGLVMFEDNGIAMTETQYQALPCHYEDDWWDWEDVCCALTDWMASLDEESDSDD